MKTFSDKTKSINNKKPNVCIIIMDSAREDHFSCLWIR